MSKEIRTKINALYAELESIIVPGTFTLNPQALRITNEIAELQSKCQHEFVKGQCIFCDAEGVNE